MQRYGLFSVLGRKMGAEIKKNVAGKEWLSELSNPRNSGLK
jgi:hypothetical protein